MSNNVWNDQSGDWNDGANWSSGSPPTANDVAILGASSPTTITGAGYFGSIECLGGDVTLAGDFSATDANSSIYDIASGSASSSVPVSSTLTLSSWSLISTGSLDLANTYLQVNGELLVNGGSSADVTVFGEQALLATSTDLDVGLLTIGGGGTVEGNVVLRGGSYLSIDDTSLLNGGTITDLGTATLALTSSNEAAETVSIADAIAISAGATLNVAAPSNATVSLEGSVLGSGVLSLNNLTAVDQAGGLVTGTLALMSSTLSIDQGDVGLGNAFLLNSGTLTITGLVGAGAVPNVTCAGSGTIEANSAGASVTLTDGGSLGLTSFSGTSIVHGLGHGTIALYGAGTTILDCVASSVTQVTLEEPPTAGAGPTMVLDGQGTATVSAGGGASLIDATQFSGDLVAFGGAGDLPTTIKGGSGSVLTAGGQAPVVMIGGSGNFDAWAGSSGHDLITGGTGANILAGSQGDTVRGYGSGSNTLIAFAGGVLLDNSRCSGTSVMFVSGKAAESTVVGGAGNEQIVNQNAHLLLQLRSGNDTVWGTSEAFNTVIGSTGNDVIVAQGPSSVQMLGSGTYLVYLSGAGSTVDGTDFHGTGIVYVSNTGLNSVSSGSGLETIVATAGPLDFVGGGGRNAVFGSPGGDDTVIGGTGQNIIFVNGGSYAEAHGSGTNMLYASGTNVTLNAASANGHDLFFLSPDANSATLYTSSGYNSVSGGGGSAAIHIVGGETTLSAGLGDINMYFDNPSSTGTLDIFGYSPHSETFYSNGQAIHPAFVGGTAPNAASDAVFYVGNETVIIHGSR